MKGKWKQNSKKKKGNVVLQKYMVAVDEFIKSKSGTEKEENDHGLRFVKKKSRKEQRKEKRKMKKAKMKNHYEGKKTLSLPPDDGENSGIPEKKKNKKMEKAKNEMSKANSSKSTSAPIEKSDNSKTPSSSKRGTKINKLQESRKMALLEANEEEDREIKKLERCLGLNRRKNKKSLPQSFVADGLDYILGMLDSGSSAAGMYDDDDDMDMAKENFEKLDENDPQLSDEDEQPEDEMASEGSDEDVGSFDDENEVDEEGEEDEDGDDEMVEEEEAEEEEMEDELDESDAADSDEEDEEEEADTLDTKTSGSKSETVNSAAGKYVPPHLRNTGDDKRKAELEKLKRNVKGLVNRLSEPNMASISGQLEELYMSCSRKDMNDTLTEVLLAACVTPTLMPDRLLMEHVLLVSILHHAVGLEVGAHFLETVVRKFDEEYKSAAEGKECDNLVTIVAHLYNFQVVHSVLIFDILKLLVGAFTEKDIELILLMLRNVGFALRKDNALALKELISEGQRKANNMGSKFQDQTRLRFMLETMLALKNNDMRKIPGYDPEPVERLRKLQRTLIHRSAAGSDMKLRVSLDNLLAAEQVGRWWIVVAAQQPHLVEIDPEFEPLSRPRSCTWPLPRPEFINPGDSNTSSPVPSVKQEPSGNAEFINNLSLLEETEDFTEQKPVILCTDFQCQESCVHQSPTPQQQQQHQQHQQQHQQHPNPQLPHHHHHHQQPQQQQQQQVPLLSSPVGSSSTAAAAAAAAQRKSSSSRRNAWGNMSYADLITKAIESSPENRLTLSQIYDWMVKSVPYFKDKGDSNSSAGWKNSIRHNLSLHSRFIRVQNEGTGKSSWWMLNPEGGKSGKSPRRRAVSMDNNSKFTKSRGRAAKKKLSLQGGPEGGADSPGSHSKWPGSPNSHSNDDFDAWNSFRPRTSSNASTLSGRLSPFMPEDDLGEADVHMGYPGAPGTKMTATLPSLTEMTGSLGHSSENVMENLLDNLNLLSPNNSQVGGGATTPGSSQSSPSPMMQPSPGYPAYSSPSMASQSQQEYRKCVYGQAGMNTLSPMSLQTLPESKPSFGPSMGQYSCPAGLLKELLTSDTDQHGELMPSVDTVVSQSSGGCMLPPYSSSQHTAKLMGGGNGHPHSLSHTHPHNVHSQAPAPSPAMNGRLLMSLSHTGGTTRLPTAKSPMQMPYGFSSHLSGGGMPGGFCPLNTNGYGRPGLPQPLHPEKLPSDLDDMSIEKFEFDMETVLHETLMDGDSLDFNFEPMVTQQGFSHGVKTTTHSWVSG